MFAVFFKGFMLVLVAVAAIVTPLGIYEGIIADANPTSTEFHYIQDTSPIGFGTPPRDENNTWSRICVGLSEVPCPNDYNNAVVVENDTSLDINYTSQWYNSRVPIDVVETFQSGTTDLESSVSSAFDIQYRSYMQSIIEDDETWNGSGPQVDNGTTRTVGVYQPLSSLLLSDGVVLIEGLIVDMNNGGIGFRNHSAPAWKEHGSRWTEDILFVVPETACVDTNLTLNYEIPRTRSEASTASSKVIKLTLADRGGFVNLDHTYPQYERADAQEDPRLWYRAYVAAWSNNAYSMAFMNVTSMNNDTIGTRSFDYLDSYFNKTFPLYYPSGEVRTPIEADPQTLSVSTLFGSYLEGTGGISNISTIGNETITYEFDGQGALYTNPFDIGFSEWNSIGKALHTTWNNRQ
jgi:hypothetical protein